MSDQADQEDLLTRVKGRGPAASGLRVLLLGATGTIGRATVAALLAAGHQVVCVVRPGRPSAAPAPGDHGSDGAASPQWRVAEVADPASLQREGIRGEVFDALVSCMASRSGTPADAWAVDHDAHCVALEVARASGIRHFVLLSALCVQKPRLAFQHAKSAFERKLMESGLRYSIVRPTAFFKSLSGQVGRVARGSSFLVFGDGRLTACKPISDQDLGQYLAECLVDPDRWDRVLPVGGPGAAITPLDQARLLEELLGRPVSVRRVPLALLDGIIVVLDLLGRLGARWAARAELARIGRYYATESMLVWDPAAGRYSSEATPAAGRQTLRGHYADLLRGRASAERGDHAVF